MAEEDFERDEARESTAPEPGTAVLYGDCGLLFAAASAVRSGAAVKQGNLRAISGGSRSYVRTEDAEAVFGTRVA